MTRDISEQRRSGAFIILDFRGDRLDPAPLVALIPFRPRLPRKKGDPVSSLAGQGGPITKTGYCGFSTMDELGPGDGNEHLNFLLTAIDPIVSQIQDIVAAYDLTWSATFFEDSCSGQFFSGLSPELLAWGARLGLSVLADADIC